MELSSEMSTIAIRVKFLKEYSWVKAVSVVTPTQLSVFKPNDVRNTLGKVWLVARSRINGPPDSCLCGPMQQSHDVNKRIACQSTLRIEPI